VPGDRGDKGMQGIPGKEGPQGPEGPTGAKGNMGGVLTGPKGEKVRSLKQLLFFFIYISLFIFQSEILDEVQKSKSLLKTISYNDTKKIMIQDGKKYTYILYM
jgi:hypothetical protein